jgi:hypothetical protein
MAGVSDKIVLGTNDLCLWHDHAGEGGGAALQKRALIRA